MERVWIGTSGWVYKGWAETFYPADLPKTRQLEYYTTQFRTVEINATFYRLPSESMVTGWYRKAPPEFIFAVKGSRYITHMKKLVDVAEGLKRYFDRVKGLKDRTGPFLWQLPPNLRKDIPRLERFLKLLPKRHEHAVEFRHPSWIDEETFDLLREYGAAQVWLSSLRMPMNCTITSKFVYLRFHGLEHGAAHDYSRDELEPWAEQLAQAARSGHRCYVYFNNDWNTRAPLNARTLIEMLPGLSITMDRMEYA